MIFAIFDFLGDQFEYGQYINDISNCSNLGSLLFADDAVLTHCHDSVKQLEKHFQAQRVPATRD